MSNLNDIINLLPNQSIENYYETQNYYNWDLVKNKSDYVNYLSDKITKLVSPYLLNEVLYENNATCLGLLMKYLDNLYLENAINFNNLIEISNPEFTYASTNNFSLGYAGFDLTNQDGQYQTNLSNRKAYDLDIISKIRQNIKNNMIEIENEFIDNIINNLLVSYQYLEL